MELCFKVGILTVLPAVAGLSRSSILSRYIYDTVCPRSSDKFYIVTYYIKWVTTSWTNDSVMVNRQWNIACESFMYLESK